MGVVPLVHVHNEGDLVDNVSPVTFAVVLCVLVYHCEGVPTNYR